jgi:hypothetical protein
MLEKELKLDWARGLTGSVVRANFGAFDMAAWRDKNNKFGFHVEYEGEVLAGYCGNPTLEAAQLAAENAARDLCEEFRRLSEVLGPKEVKLDKVTLTNDDLEIGKE